MHTLSESYVGLPHVLNVLIEWLHAAGTVAMETCAIVLLLWKHVCCISACTYCDSLSTMPSIVMLLSSSG